MRVIDKMNETAEKARQQTQPATKMILDCFRKMNRIESSRDGINIKTGTYDYWIDAKRIDTPEKILGWTNQLCHKRWIDAELMGWFVIRAFSRINIKIDYNI